MCMEVHCASQAHGQRSSSDGQTHTSKRHHSRLHYGQTAQHSIRLNDSLPWFTMSIIASETNVTGGINTGSTLAGLLKSSSVCALPFRFFSCECVTAVFAWRFRYLSLSHSFHGTRRRISEQVLDS